MKVARVQVGLAAVALLAVGLVALVVRAPDSGWAKAAPLCAAILVFIAAEILRQRVEHRKGLSELRRELRDAHKQVLKVVAEDSWDSAAGELATAAATVTLAIALCDELGIGDTQALFDWSRAVADAVGKIRGTPTDARTPKARVAILDEMFVQMQKADVAKWLRKRFEE